MNGQETIPPSGSQVAAEDFVVEWQLPPRARRSRTLSGPEDGSKPHRRDGNPTRCTLSASTLRGGSDVSA